MRPSVKLFLGAYYHPPACWTDDLLERYYLRNLKPVLAQLYAHRNIALSFYFSGPFVEWLVQRHPGSINVVVELIKARRVEILTGGYSAPLFPLVAHRERILQIEKLTAVISKIFSKRPRGFWLTRGVWDESLPAVLCQAGIEYTFLPIESYSRIGVEDIRAVYRLSLTESQGRIISVLPVSFSLANSIAGGRTEELWGLVDRLYQSSDGASVPCAGVFLDGDRPLEEATIQALFSQIVERSEWLETTLPMQFLRQHHSPSHHYFFPSSGFKEVVAAGATLPPAEQYKLRASYKQILSALRGFNQLYQKMMHVSFMIWSVRGDKYRRSSALEMLYLAQDHHFYCPWDEQPNLDQGYRNFVMEKLITAESNARTPGSPPTILRQDFNLDRREEFLFKSRSWNIVVDVRGAQVIDWDLVAKKLNLGWAPSDERVENRRYSLADFWGESPELSSLEAGTETLYDRLWTRDFKVQEFDHEKFRLNLSWKGVVHTSRDDSTLRIDKSFHFDDVEWTVTYFVQNQGADRLTGTFGPELRLNLPLTTSPALDRPDMLEHVVDHGKRKGVLEIHADHPFHLKAVRVRQEVGDFYRLLLLWGVELDPGQSVQRTFRFARVKR